MYVLNPLNLNQLQEIFDEKAIMIIDYFIKKSIFSQPEIKKSQKKLPIQIPKEHIEQRFSQGLNAKNIGAGSYPIDLISCDGAWGADIKMLSAKVDKEGFLTMSDSGETSLGQNFKTVGNGLDQMFQGREYEKIKNLRIDLIREKLKKPKEEYSIEKIYYFILLRGGDFLYILGMNVDTSNLIEVSVDEQRSSNDSVYLDQYIDKKFGNVKIYKAKKRMELRLCPKPWQELGFLIPFELSIDTESINFRELLESGNDILEYGKTKANNIFN